MYRFPLTSNRTDARSIWRHIYPISQESTNIPITIPVYSSLASVYWSACTLRLALICRWSSFLYLGTHKSAIFPKDTIHKSLSFYYIPLLVWLLTIWSENPYILHPSGSIYILRAKCRLGFPGCWMYGDVLCTVSSKLVRRDRCTFSKSAFLSHWCGLPLPSSLHLWCRICHPGGNSPGFCSHMFVLLMQIHSSLFSYCVAWSSSPCCQHSCSSF